MKPGVYITFDVECSMGGAWDNPDRRPVSPERAIWGRFGRRELGLPLIVDTLGRRQLPGTFFLEAFIDEQGYPGTSEPIARYLLERGHDVQLHIHPNHLHYGWKLAGREHPMQDNIGRLPPDAQRAMLAEGVRRLTEWTGRAPVAFRAGNMGASEETLRQMEAVGLLIDSSYTFMYLGGQCDFAETQAYNGSKWYGGVLELALSGFRQPSVPGLRPAKPLDLVGISFEECRDGIRAINAAGADAVVILHSFSLFKVRDKQYNAGKLNRVVAKRFDWLCQWLGRHRDEHPCYTFEQLAGAVRQEQYTARTVEPPLFDGAANVTRALARKFVQGVNNCYWV